MRAGLRSWSIGVASERELSEEVRRELEDEDELGRHVRERRRGRWWRDEVVKVMIGENDMDFDRVYAFVVGPAPGGVKERSVGSDDEDSSSSLWPATAEGASTRTSCGSMQMEWRLSFSLRKGEGEAGEGI